MAQSLEALTRQDETLKSIRSIVRTMKSLAAINATPYENAALAIQAYQQTVHRGFSAFAWRMQTVFSPAMRSPSDHHIVVVFGSDHGFCGNYNSGVAQTAHAFCTNQARAPATLICVGAKMEEALDQMGMPVSRRLRAPASVEGVGRLAGEVVAQIEQHSRGHALAELCVSLIFTLRGQHGSQIPTILPLLPLRPALLEPPQKWPSRALPDFTMSAAGLLSALLRHYLFASVFHASAEAIVTENAARLALMRQAEQSVDERLDALRLDISTQRQDAITHELMDIVMGHTQGLS